MLTECLRGLSRGVVEVELLGTDQTHHGVEDTELTSRQGTDHHATRGQAHRAQVQETDLAHDVAQTLEHTAVAARALLVDLGQQGVRRVRDDRSHHARNHTRLQRDDDVLVRGQSLRRRAPRFVDHLRSLALDRELRHRVRDLLAQDRDEPAVESTDQPRLGLHLLRARKHARGVVRLGHQTDTARLVRAQENVRNKLRNGGRRQVDLVAVLPRRLLAQLTTELDLEVLNTAELEPALHKVTLRRRPQTRQQTTSALGRDHAPRTADQTITVRLRVQLDPGLHNVHRHNTTVRDRAAQTTRNRRLQEVLLPERTLSHELLTHFA
eukprot:Hpha_TRINITY_DN15734_c2_g3::TRINITY_DN15734_c2_g3_i2::g.40396::m.40396